MQVLPQHIVTGLTDSQRVGGSKRGQNSADVAVRASVLTEDAIEAVGGFARDEAIGQAERGEKVAALNVLAQTVRGDGPVDLPQVVAYTNDHRRAINRATWRAAREKSANSFIVYSGFNAGVKGRVHTILCLIAEPRVWGRLLRSPRQTWRYAAKYSRATCRIHPSSLGGFTIEGPFNRRPSRIARALDRFFYWLGA
ncbi:hypothetical protein [Paraburkholderia acidipaludis]|uniref:hypothetical protein n=1 Tax=Paraburkholderia acidipaludis TaxID=660537 RepID=UPI0012EB7C54|nr:hypothetical protein [Paraburkholderia acidipaludis]